MENVNINLFILSTLVTYFVGVLCGFLIGGNIGWDAGFKFFARNKEVLEGEDKSEK